MNKSLLLILAAVLLLPAQVRAADTGMVSEVFACTFKEGKDWEDFEEVNAKFADILEQIGGAATNLNAWASRTYTRLRTIPSLMALPSEWCVR